MRIGIVGGGFMGEAFLRGILRARVATPDEVTVAEIVESARARIAGHGVRVTADAQTAAIGAELVLLAVKPEQVVAVAQGLSGAISGAAVLVSIAAGVPLGEIQRACGHRACVRVMPNLPAAIGAGAAVYFATEGTSAEQRRRVLAVLEAVATAVVEAHSDDEVDRATAVHASGPAYVYLVIEAMIDAAVRLGMKRADATALVLATVAGAARYAIESGDHPAQLRNAVTSPGGTTAAALAELEAAGLRSAFDDAIEAAYIRARELGE